MIPEELIGLLRHHKVEWRGRTYGGEEEGTDAQVSGEDWPNVTIGSFVVFPTGGFDDDQEGDVHGEWRATNPGDVFGDSDDCDPWSCFDGGTVFGADDVSEQPQEEDLGAYDIHDPHQLGVAGEKLAAMYLQKRGYKILERNYRNEFGEADIVCSKGESVILVEVKTRFGADAFPEEAVNEEKLRRYRKITRGYLNTHEWHDNVRLDVVAINVTREREAHIHHFIGVCSWES